MIHDFDWLRWTLGEVKSLFSRSLSSDETGSGPDYHALTTLTFENGCVAHVEGTWMDPGGFRTSFEIAGSKGLIQHDSRDNSALRTTTKATGSEGAPLPSLEGNFGPLEDPYYLELDGFLTAVRTSTLPPISGRDGIPRGDCRSRRRLSKARRRIAWFPPSGPRTLPPTAAFVPSCLCVKTTLEGAP